MKSTMVRWGLAALIIAAIAGCGGGGGGVATTDTGTGTGTVTPPPATGPGPVTPTAQATTLAATASGETCAICHTGDTPVARSGPGHQADYDQLYQYGVITVSNMAIASNGVDQTTLTFKLTKSGANLDCTKTTDGFTIGSYYDSYDAATKKFTAASPISLKPTTTGTSPNGTITYDGAGGCTFVKTFTASGDKALVAAITTADGLIQVYGVDEVLETNSAKHMNKGRYPFAGLLRLGPNMGAATAPYVSAANVSGCENCHTQPFGKHAYIAGKVDDLTPGTASPTQQFYVCKTCHSDARNGGHVFWQLLKEAKLATEATPSGQAYSTTTQALRDRAVAVDGGAATTTDENTKYAYKTRLMNDVHMSHAMEFAYPQSMRNCVTCHEGKMDETTGIFKPANFRAETCISCHAPDGIIAKMKAANYNHSSFVGDVATLKATDCTGCHGTIAGVPTFKTIHTGGYDPKIYAADGTRYSTNIKVTINSASLANNVLTANFSASGSVGSIAATSITPTVIVGLYGYNTKDYIVNAHASDANGKRYLEFKFGDTNPRFTGTVVSPGSWKVTADLSAWATMIADGTIKRAEIAVLPEVKNAAGTVLGLDAPSRTFDLTTKAFADTYFTDIVNVKKTNVTTSKGVSTVKGCNTCHDQLATTFHSGIRGGNIRVCRLCHVKSSGAFHLELQSRSIDSFVHAIHSFQDFDIRNINFADSFEAMEYRHHTETFFPRFGLGDGATDCESCHVTGKYEVSDQSKSLPALWSGSDTLTGTTRNIGTVPSYVSGPAETACGGCHRAQLIVEDDAGGLLTVLNHWKQNGYLLENVSTLWDAVVAKVMAPFK